MVYCLLLISDRENIFTCSVVAVCAKPAVKKKKSVHFGNPLSPEVFDKTMPPSTPLRKGGTPARTPTPGRGLRLRSALKTPQASDSDWAGPDPGNPFVFGASPTPVTPVTRRTLAAADSEEEGKVGSCFSSSCTHKRCMIRL